MEVPFITLVKRLPLTHSFIRTRNVAINCRVIELFLGEYRFHILFFNFQYRSNVISVLSREYDSRKIKIRKNKQYTLYNYASTNGDEDTNL